MSTPQVQDSAGAGNCFGHRRKGTASPAKPNLGSDPRGRFLIELERGPCRVVGRREIGRGHVPSRTEASKLRKLPSVNPRLLIASRASWPVRRDSSSAHRNPHLYRSRAGSSASPGWQTSSQPPAALGLSRTRIAWSATTSKRPDSSSPAKAVGNLRPADNARRESLEASRFTARALNVRPAERGTLMAPIPSSRARARTTSRTKGHRCRC